MGAPTELAPGLWRWTARHPEWHPAGFGDEVASFALTDPNGTALVDPLLPRPEDGRDEVLAALDALVAAPVRILVTLGYHARSSEELAARYDAPIAGPANVARRLGDTTRFTAIEAGRRDDGPAGGVVAFAVGSPRRTELPLYLPAHRALAFGDMVVGVDGALRVWLQLELTAEQVRRYERRVVPTLEPLLDLELDHVLVTHGVPAIGDGHVALAAALAAPPWNRQSAA